MLRLTRRLQLRDAGSTVPRLHPPQPAHRGHAPDRTGKGYWMAASDGASSLRTPVLRFHRSITSTSPSWPWRPRRGEAMIYEPPTAASSTSATRPLGSTAHPPEQPSWAFARTPDGGGLRLVARDGGIFNFGNAPFGLHGFIHLTSRSWRCDVRPVLADRLRRRISTSARALPRLHRLHPLNSHRGIHPGLGRRLLARARTEGFQLGTLHSSAPPAHPLNKARSAWRGAKASVADARARPAVAQAPATSAKVSNP